MEAENSTQQSGPTDSGQHKLLNGNMSTQAKETATSNCGNDYSVQANCFHMRLHGIANAT